MNEDDEARQLVIDYKQTFGSPHGERTFKHMKACAKFDFAIVPLDSLGRIDSHEVTRQLGTRSVIIGIETMLKTKPDETKGIQNVRRDDDGYSHNDDDRVNNDSNESI